MKKFIILSLVSLMAFASCSKHDFNTSYVDAQRDRFEVSFEKQFGTPAADQDWGFNSENIQFALDATKAATRGHDVNRNQWSEKYNIPANVTAEEEQAVLNKLAEGSGNRDAKMTVDWPNFFVYHVHKGTDSYRDHANQNTGVVSDNMNHLQAGHPGAVANEAGELVGDWEHINDFNSGQQNANWWTIEGATVMVNSSTANFAYHNSRDSKYHDCFTVIDGNDIGYPGFYYICFDFLANGDIEKPANKNMGVDRNYNYTDWIVRISPAEFNTNGAVRIIAEDLGQDTGSDFDYNDVVFDAKVTKEWVGSLNNNYFIAYITIQAAGGTLPLFVAGEEVHNKFGVGTDVMVNTGQVSKPAASFVAYLRPIGNNEWNLSAVDVVKSIPVTVLYKNGESTNLGVETGKAPEKICVNTNFSWTRERQPIYEKYPLFPNWVTDKTVDWQN